MPPLRLTSILQATLPKLSATSWAVVSTLACRNGRALPPNQVAQWVGLNTRFQLARALRRDGLPPLERLADWTRVVHWVLETESTGASLRRMARRERLDPAVAYRLVRRATGLRWSDVRRAGLAAALQRLRDLCTPRIFGARPTIRDPRLDAEVVARSVVPRTLAQSPAMRGHPRGILATRLRIDGCPNDVAFSGDGLAWVTRGHAAAVDCVQLDPLCSLGHLRTGSVPTRIALGSDGSRAYITTQFADAVDILDLASHRHSASLPVPGNAHAVALAPDGRLLYVTTNADRLCAATIRDRHLIASVPIPNSCIDLELHPSGNQLYVPVCQAGVILEVDPRSLRTIRRFDVGGAVQSVAVSRDGLMLYVANEGGWLDAINLGEGRRVAALDLGMPAVDVALSPDMTVLYVTLTAVGKVAIVDRPSLTLTTILDTGGAPRRVGFDRSGRAALIANEAGWVDLVR